MLPAHVLLSEHAEANKDRWLGFSLGSQQEARAARRRHLDTAARMLENALAANAGNVEAIIRLAHVRLLTGEPEAGAALLKQAPPTVHWNQRAAYLRLLVLGRILEKLGSSASAAEQFRDAAALHPAQSARIGLSHALHRAGRAGEAAEVIEALLRDPEGRPDPWASYTYGQFWTIDPLLAALRSEARR